MACTNYIAGLWQADQKLQNMPKATKDHKKVVIFISDGIPVYYYMASAMNWDDPSGMKRYGAGAEVYTYQDSGSSSKQIYNYVGHSTAKTFYESPYFNETLKIFKDGDNSFVKRNPNIIFHTVAIDMSKEKINGWDRTTLLKDMAKEYGGTTYSASNSSGLKKYLQSVMFPTGVTISDTLSKYVELYESRADILVTATSKTDPTKQYLLWNQAGYFAKDGSGTKGKFTLLENNKVDGNLRNPAVNFDNKRADAKKTELNGAVQSVTYDEATRTLAVHFNDNYSMSDEYTYTLSFNVRLTEEAYDYYAEHPNYKGTEGDLGTDYPGNATSSEKLGMHSNKSATVTFKIEDQSGELTYDHPVVQAWRTRFFLRKIDDKGQSIANIPFKLVRKGETPEKDVAIPAANQDKCLPYSKAKDYYLTNNKGGLDFGKLKHGEYELYEYVQPGFAGGPGEVLVATFTVQKGRITNVVEDAEAAAAGITAEWTGAKYDPSKDNNTPNTTYDDGSDTLTVTNTRTHELKIIKHDDAGHPLAGATFELTDEDGDPVTDSTHPNGEYTSAEQTGLVFDGWLAAGTYTMTETEAPAGYAKAKDFQFTVSDEGGVTLNYPEGFTDDNYFVKLKQPDPDEDDTTTITMTIANKPDGYKVVVEKVDSVRPERKLAGAQFALWEAEEKDDGTWDVKKATDDTDTPYLWQGVSDENGRLDKGSVNGEDGQPFPLLSVGKYILREMKAPPGYNILHDDIRIEVTINEAGEVVIQYYLKPDGDGNLMTSTLEDGTTCYTFTVSNDGGYELPKTGGVGTYWYTLSGTLLIGCALVYIAFAGRRRKRE